MTGSFFIQRFTLSLLAVLSVSNLLVRTAYADEWDFVLAPYAQVPYISGDASLGRIEDAKVDIDPSDILDNLKIGAMLQAEVHHKSGFGLVLNYAFMDLEDAASGPRGFTNFDAEIFQGVFESFLSYRIEREAGLIDFYAGARYWDIDLEMSADNALGSIDYDREEDWLDPVMGMRVKRDISEKWDFLLVGDVGGFAGESNNTFSAMAGLLYSITQNTSLALTYKAIWVDYSHGSIGEPDRFKYNTVSHAPLLGVVMKF